MGEIEKATTLSESLPSVIGFNREAAFGRIYENHKEYEKALECYTKNISQFQRQLIHSIVLCGNMTGNQGNMGNQTDQNGGWTPGGNQNSGWFPGNGNQNGNWTPGGNWMPCSQCQQGNQGISGTPRNGSNRQSMMDMPGMNLR